MEITRMPAVFVGHGSPMNAIEDNAFSRAWSELGQTLPKPNAILCVSAHWETRGTLVTGMDKPRTIHDFSDFPPELYKVEYPAPGSPDLAWRLCEEAQITKIQPDMAWGLDHGVWSVLRRLFPQADIPVVQMSIDHYKDARFHYELGRSLRGLRDEGILIIGSGNIVHNLRKVSWIADTGFDWAVEFDRQASQWILDNNHAPLLQPERQGRAASLSVNSAEHFLPLLYVLGAKYDADPVRFFAEGFVAGSISMRGIQVG
jgi:4,5-DOPA dioxygenase extradiol